MTDTPPDAPAQDPAQKSPVEENGSLGLPIDASVQVDDDAGPYIEAMDQHAEPAPAAPDPLISELTHRHFEKVVVPQQDTREEQSPSTGHRLVEGTPQGT